MNPISKVKGIIITFHWLLASQLGIDPLRFAYFIKGIPKYWKDLRSFRRQASGRITIRPCLHDFHDSAGRVANEYFWQDLMVAQWIHEARPKKHIDVGSRLDGFVAHVASYREIEVIDIRPVQVNIPRVKFKQMDLMSNEVAARYGMGYCDSISCLHAIEHFGLGRYGDPLDPYGLDKGLANLASLLQPGGTLYLSLPIGKERVEFNAQRITDPRSLIALAEKNALRISRLVVVSNGCDICEDPVTPDSLSALSNENYRLGIFTFNKCSGGDE